MTERDEELPRVLEGRAARSTGGGDGRRTERIRDVAQHAGVSPATVSRVLNDVETVNEDLRRRVQAAVAELDYRPNRLARNLRRQSAEMIGILVSDIENPHFSEMVRAVEDAAFRNEYRVLLCNTDESRDKQRAYLEMLAAERVLGVIMSPNDPSAEEISELLDLEIPVVAFDRGVTDPRADAVVVDGRSAAIRATEHLISAGHERIGFVGGPVTVETGADRLAGYKAAMAGLTPLAVDGGFRMASAREATEELLVADPPLTALVVANNLMTIGALEALKAHGRRVPDDVALVGIDDPFWAALVDPPLTALAQPVRPMADAAVRLLLERIRDGRTERRREVFDLELRVRGSCGTRTDRKGRAG